MFFAGKVKNQLSFELSHFPHLIHVIQQAQYAVSHVGQLKANLGIHMKS